MTVQTINTDRDQHIRVFGAACGMADRDLPGSIACHSRSCRNGSAASFRSWDNIVLMIAVPMQAVEVNRDFVEGIVCAAGGMTNSDFSVIATRRDYLRTTTCGRRDNIILMSAMVIQCVEIKRSLCVWIGCIARGMADRDRSIIYL